ncbi:RimJ/RimL family protein N-acetyltransferase [Asanoa ferruginea]|uniref:RimJ/RimL family protein N-acetyltransferase n=1 Tax=Asanoa ferruginea TaxID=53367 RepID=A0A3D9ZZE5_9ACTN|nr:GNAT family N-acetyltransferase [Asanoa ferruginea]REG01534.1 RimJ/RimL family protein N-acetyltransferase [Asanoa ferruginea]GIF47839.1 N-acetyltransferase [Asanoa ferruginea]
MTDVALRALEDGDLDAIFAQMSDPESVWMAAFTSRDPADRAAFDAHMKRIRALPDVRFLAVTRDGELVGTIGSFVMEGETDITYWIDRAYWGQGIASRAVAAFLDLVTERPLYGRAASDNLGSLKVLRRAGFREIGTEISHANARGGEIEETVLRLE